MRFAYADPPYIGKARKLYNCDEIDHKQLIETLNTFDAWALSCSSPTLKQILVLCPDDVRVMAWVKPVLFIQTECQSSVCLGTYNRTWVPKENPKRTNCERLGFMQYNSQKRTYWS